MNSTRHVALLLLLAACSGEPKDSEETKDSSADTATETDSADSADTATDPFNFTIDFETPDYAEGALNGQQGWVDEDGIAMVDTSEVSSGLQAAWFDFSVDSSATYSDAELPVAPPEGTRLYTVSMMHALDRNASWSGFLLSGGDCNIVNLTGINTGASSASYTTGAATDGASSGWKLISVTVDFDTRTHEAFVGDTSLGVRDFEPCETDATAIDTLRIYAYAGTNGASGHFDDISVEMSL